MQVDLAGVAVRGGISAFIVVLVATGFWIVSGWKAGFMMAEMAAICACILTSMDNPVPALKIFIRASLYAAIIVFIYAYGIFPHISAFWMLAVVLAPFCMYCLMLFLHRTHQVNHIDRNDGAKHRPNRCIKKHHLVKVITVLQV